jgi:hypothetical protein
MESGLAEAGIGVAIKFNGIAMCEQFLFRNVF